MQHRNAEELQNNVLLIAKYFLFYFTHSVRKNSACSPWNLIFFHFFFCLYGYTRKGFDYVGICCTCVYVSLSVLSWNQISSWLQSVSIENTLKEVICFHKQTISKSSYIHFDSVDVVLFLRLGFFDGRNIFIYYFHFGK